jgi:hypothetical protein
MQGIAQLPPDFVISEIQSKGFRGLWIDTYGYADNAASMPAKAIATLLGQQPLASPDGRYLFFDLTSSHVAPAPPVEASSMPFTRAQIHQGGSCNVDSINDSKVPPAVQRAVAFHIEGWMADIDSGLVQPEVYVEFSDAGGKRLYLHGSRFARGDVASHFNKPSLMQSGFAAGGKLDSLPPGSYRLRILQVGPGTVQACDANLPLELR